MGHSHVDREAFAFVQELAEDLSRGNIELPSFPEIAMRVRRALSNDQVATKDLVRLIGSEPTLAARIMQMANSAALGRRGNPISDLRTAITRIGFNLVRSAAVAFAMAQLRRSEDLKSIKSNLHEHWERSALVAAFSYVIARQHTTINADTAMLAGLLHGIGRLYIIARAVKHKNLFADQAAFMAIERDWQSSIAQALLENWGMSEDIVAAIRDYEDLEREHEGPTDLTDVLTVATLLATFHHFPDSLELNLQGAKATARMNLTRDALDHLIRDSSKEVGLVKQTLGL
jgi:HD-like signal output (HDOD) protein